MLFKYLRVEEKGTSFEIFSQAIVSIISYILPINIVPYNIQ